MNASPKWFKGLAVAGLLWNLLGCLAFAADLRLTPEDVARLPEAHQALYAARPAWALAATAIAVIGGALGCTGMLFGKRWAFPLLVLSLLGILVQDYAMFILVDGLGLAGSVAALLQGMVLLVGVALVALARKGVTRGWLTH